MGFDSIALPIQTIFDQVQPEAAGPLPDSFAGALAQATSKPTIAPGEALVMVQDGQRFLVSTEALAHMMAMGLGQLPVQTIALPEPLFNLLPSFTKIEQDVSHHLTEHFSNFFVAAIYELYSIFHTQQSNAYIIGGLIRDMFLETTKKLEIYDADLTVEGQALEAAHWVVERSKNFELTEQYPHFGTAKLKYKGKLDFDFASTRREAYAGCGHLPDILEVGVPLRQDIIRRDFTVNTLALSITQPGKIIDYLGGLKDVKAHQLRALTAFSFFEDPSRIFRAIKYAIRLDFEWAPETQYLIDEAMGGLPSVYKGGGERMRDEWFELLVLPESTEKLQWLGFFVERGLHRLIDTRLPRQLALPIPLTVVQQRLQFIQEQLSDEVFMPIYVWQVYLCIFLLGLPEAFQQGAINRLGLTRHEIEVFEKSFHLLQENKVCAMTPQTSAAELYDTFHTLPFGAIAFGLVLSPLIEQNLQAYQRYVRDLEGIHLEICGDDIMKLGVPEGAQVGQLLKALHYAKLSGTVVDRSDEIEWIKSQIKSS